MKVIRYSHAFKMQAVRQVETGELCAAAVQRQLAIQGHGTVLRWVRQWGSGKYGKVVRVEHADQVAETTRLRRQLRQAKEALADAHMALALEQAFLEAACEQLDQPVAGFKKKHAGRPRTRSSKPIRTGR